MLHPECWPLLDGNVLNSVGNVDVQGVCSDGSLFFFSSRRRHTRLQGDWSSDVCSSDLQIRVAIDRDRAADLGISLEVVGQTLETVLGSRIVTTYVDRGREYNVIVQGREDRKSVV